MSAQEAERMLDIITNLLSITRKMSTSSKPDFLSDAIDRRGDLMAEYDALKASCDKADLEAKKPQITEMINEIIELDKTINKTLQSLRNDVKLNLKSSNQNSKVLQYTNQAISSTGSYIDLKE